ncbi:MAG: aminoacyl-tRNA hydrolase [Acidobacteria bacterium]|nr:aminoacyl-tRNA hydrolase [Acidobacteriota bacterium]
MSSLLDNDWMVVGLGNPGPEYAKTRHNLGFMTVDLLAYEEQTQIKREECRALVGRAVIGGKTVELVKPITYMNLSGDAVGCLMKKPERSAERLIVISDDLALPLGKIRIRPKGSHGGHNGLRSIFDHLKTNEVIRVRIGIMPDHPVGNTKDFVLRPFAGSEREAVENAIKDSADAIRAILGEGVEAAMAKFN